MNNRLLRQINKILEGRISPQEGNACLRYYGAKIWLEQMGALHQLPAELLPKPPKLSEETIRQIQAVFLSAPAGKEGTANAFTPDFFALAREQTAKNQPGQGIFYTPWQFAGLLCRETLQSFLTHVCGLPPAYAAACFYEQNIPLSQAQKQRLSTRLDSLSIADPACGAGGLLIPFWLELGKLQHRLRPERPKSDILLHIARHSLYAADLDSSALDDLRLRVYLTLAAEGIKPSEDILPHLYPGNALATVRNNSLWKIRFKSLFTQNGGFDIVISNPPYVGQKNHKTVFENLRQNPHWRPRLAPKGDLLYLFFHLALDILRPRGVAGFLTTAYFAQAASAYGLRMRLKEETAFLRLIDFHSKSLFARARGQHNLISVFQKTTDKSALCRIGENNQTVSQTELYSGPAHFLTTAAQDDITTALLRKMEAAPLRLKDVASVSNGLMTGCDKISAAHLSRHRLPGVQKGEGVFVLSQKQKDALRLSPAELTKLKPFFKNSDIAPYTANTAAKYWLVDFFYPNDRETDFSVYPHLTAHLARFKPVLLARKQNNNGIDKQLKKGVYWFASVRRKLDFDAEKLVVPHRARTNTFAFAPGPWYASSDVYFISAPKPGFSLWYLLALFNSAPYYSWLYYHGKRKGNLLELYAQPLSELPVPHADTKTQTELETWAKEIYRKKTENPVADTSREENTVNRLVGKLFGLTQEELTLAERRKQTQKA